MVGAFVGKVGSGLGGTLCSVFKGFASRLGGLVVGGISARCSGSVVGSTVSRNGLINALNTALSGVVESASVTPLVDSLNVLSGRSVTRLIRDLVSVARLGQHVAVSRRKINNPVSMTVVSGKSNFM